MNNLDNDWSFNQFKIKNQPNFFSGINYIYAIFKLKDVPFDLFDILINFIYPNFLIIENNLFIMSEFDQNKYNGLIDQKMDQKKIQFWMNLIEITSIHEELSEERALLLANKIASSWNAKIKYEAISANGLARVIHDTEYGEVFVTID